MRLSTLALLLAFMAAPALAGVNLTATVGETFIRCQWDQGYAGQEYDMMVYHNGIWYGNTSLNYTTFSDLEPSERHRITLVNQSNTTQVYDSLTVSTSMPSMTIYTMLVIGFGFLVGSVVFRRSIFGVLGGMFCAVVYLPMAVFITGYATITGYVLVAVGAVALIMVVYNLYGLFSERYV